MTIGERIKITRENRGMSQESLGKFCGSGKQTIYKYENNIVSNIPTDKLERIASALHVSPAYLMGWSVDPDETKKESPLPISGLELSEVKRRAIERILTLSDDEIEYLDRLADAALAR